MNIFALYADRISQALAKLNIPLPDDFTPVVEPPRQASHGDLATNAALVLAKTAKQPPRALAEALADSLRDDADIADVTIAGPGFLNIRLAARVWRGLVKDIIGAGQTYGASTMGQGQKVNVEYVSANPTGPMHVGHCRGAVVGDALANLLIKAGHEVGKEYYINDAGAQVDVLARSLHLRYREALGQDIGAIPEGLYPGDYLIPVGQALAQAHGDRWLAADETDWLPDVRRFAIDAMMDLIRIDLAVLGVTHDVFFSEASLQASGRIDTLWDDLKSRDLAYEGVLEPPKGKKPEDWEPVPLPLFRATRFGDDVDRPLKKSDGSWTYFGADTAYHADKLARGFTKLINVWGADHAGTVKRLKSAVEAVSGQKDVLSVLICQMVRLTRDGEPVKMSKRAGTFVTLREVVDEVGRDAVRFMMLTRKSDAQLDFDFNKVVEQSKDNPVFYVQYAHARACSAFRKAAELMPDMDVSETALAKADLALIDDDQALTLMKRLAQWPRLVEQAAQAYEPHRVAFYLYDLASDFHILWNRGNDEPSRRFVQPDAPALTLAYLALVRAVAVTIVSGLAILGVSAPEELS